MQRVKPLLFVLLTCTLLSCVSQKAAPTIIGAEKTSRCGELPAGVTIDKRQFHLAGLKLGEFSLGEADINSTPEFTQILSEASKDKVVQSVLTCDAIELAGVQNNAEMVAYFIEMQNFLATNPSVDDRIKWKKAFPFPKAAPQEQSATRESSEIRFAKSCKQPVDGLRRQPESFVPIWLDMLRILYKEKFPADRDLLNLYRVKGRYRDAYHTPEDYFRESLYTVKCLEDAGEMMLENLGATITYEAKTFTNQRLIFKSP